MEHIPVRGYSIFVEAGLRTRFPELISENAPAARYVIITDENVEKLYATDLLQSFTDRGLKALLYAVDAGEASKCRLVKAGIEDWMLEQRCGRDTTIVALGGGVVGDLAGFVAATYMRGIPFVQCPTSLLACVDSSIGGKTGIDTPAGKNLVGAFHRPKAVLIDVEFLKTLPTRELSNGMAEIIKAGAIRDEKLFELLESSVEQILSTELDVLSKVVHRGAQIKAEVVVADEFEGGIRAILNFGHSIGHAIEALKSPELLHGECVSIGMVLEAQLAKKLGFLKDDDVSIYRLSKCLEAFKLPISIDPALATPDLLARMSVDKKNRGLDKAQKSIVMLTGIGSVNSQPKFTTSVPDSELEVIFADARG